MIKLNVILDIDSTIINTVTWEEGSKLLKYYKEDDYYIYQPEGYEKSIIFKRPTLDVFLEWLFKNCNVSIFTHADKDYAMDVIDRFVLTKMDRKLDFIFYRYHVEFGIKKYSCVKDLRIIWDDFLIFDFYPSNTVLIDDNEVVKRCNLYNTLQITAFIATDPESLGDKHLLHIKEKLEYLLTIYNKNKGDEAYDVPILKLYEDNINRIY